MSRYAASSWCPSKSAVYIRNLCKQYGDGQPVLNNFSMTIQRGTIYSLLGSSGCGKTTVLSCIVGLRSWDSGDLLVYGEKPGTRESGIPGKMLGYVPQDIALYQQLSVREVIQFYGRIYNMTDDEIERKWKPICTLLELDRKFKLISEMSGGQKRRASLALALIHSPQLLILDEPTVGLDPLLRRKIWDYLHNHVKTYRSTILITTHYIEEARNSNMLGVMRRGRLLIEDTPTNLLQLYNCDLLEEAVLQLCHRDEASLNLPEITSHTQYIDATESYRPYKPDNDPRTLNFSSSFMEYREQYLKTSFMSNLRRMQGFITVILLTFARHPILLALIMMIPALQVFLTTVTMGYKPVGMHLGIVNKDLANWTMDCDMPRHSSNSCDLITPLSCKFINLLKLGDVVILEAYESEEIALQQVYNAKSWGYMVFPENYTLHQADFATAGLFSTNETLEGSRIKTFLDYSQSITVNFMIKHFYTAYLEYLQQLSESCQVDVGENGLIPLKFRKPVYGNEDDNYSDFLIPGVTISILEIIICMLTSVIYITDRKDGTLSRARVAGLTVMDVLLSHIISQAFVVVGQIICWFFLLRYVLHTEVIGSLWSCVFINLLAGICGAGLGLLQGVLCRDEVQAMINGTLLGPIMLLFGGVFFPTEGMSRFWRNVGYILPMSLPTHSLRSVIIRGLPLLHPTVWPGLAVLAAWIIGLIFITTVLYKKSSS